VGAGPPEAVEDCAGATGGALWFGACAAGVAALEAAALGESADTAGAGCSLVDGAPAVWDSS
jgi:hypothetical protein